MRPLSGSLLIGCCAWILVTLGPGYWGRWEIAEIGILVAFRRGGIVQQTKIALLQSKRLYPEEAEAPAEDQLVDYEVGFARLLETEQEFRSATRNRKFTFTRNSCYRALDYQGEQHDAILKYMTDTEIPVHYLLHNPPALPSTAVLPVIAKEDEIDVDSCEVGCRVVRAQDVDARLKAAKLKKRGNPSFTQMVGNTRMLDKACWRLEHFVADLVIGCQEGYRGGTNPMQDPGLYRVFARRSGPISAAISISIDAPTG
jgi:hypothetical protein